MCYFFRIDKKINRLLATLLLIIYNIGCKRSISDNNIKKGGNTSYLISNKNHQKNEPLVFELPNLVVKVGEIVEVPLKITKVIGNLEDYFIKKIVVKNQYSTTNYKGKFDLGQYESCALTTLAGYKCTPSKNVAPGDYTLSITIGQQGRKHKKTESTQTCVITVLKSPESPITSAKSKDFIKRSLNFELGDVSLEVGETAALPLQFIGTADLTGYVIKEISVKSKTKGSYCTKNFGLNLHKDCTLTNVNSCSCTPNVTVKPGAYILSVKVGKKGKGSRPTETTQKCTITVLQTSKNTNDSICSLPLFSTSSSLEIL